MADFDEPGRAPILNRKKRNFRMGGTKWPTCSIQHQEEPEANVKQHMRKHVEVNEEARFVGTTDLEGQSSNHA